MEVAEQTPIVNKTSWFSRVVNRLFPKTWENIPPASVPQPQAEVITQNVSLPEKPAVRNDRSAREARKAAYVAAKSQSTEIVILPPAHQEKPKVSQSEVRAPGLPSSFQEVRKSEQSLAVSQKDLPWLEQESHSIPLVEITLAGSDRQRFFYGSAILGKALVEAAKQLDKHRSGITNNLLYSHLPEFIRSNNHPYIKLVHDPATERPIYNVYNKGGQRVYFMRFDKLQGIPVIIRVAVCDKDRQAQVLGMITTRSHKVIKQTSSL